MQGPDSPIMQFAASFQAAFQRQQGQVLVSSTGGSMEVMDLRLQCMTDFKAFFDDSVRRQVVKHVRHRNALLPIGTLPTELLQNIFNLLLLTSRGSRIRRFVPTLITLRAVSWSCRDLLEGTPTFWTHISSEDDIRFVSEALEKSNHAPLHLQHIGKYGDGPESPFFEKLAPQSHRWESVTIHQPNIELAAKYFNLLTPTIKAFVLSSLDRYFPEPGLSNLFEEGKNLEELRIANCGPVGWRGLSCTRLRVLEIEGQNSLDTGVLLDILAANPDLEVIRLHTLTFVQYVQPQSNPPPLFLNGLKELMLKDITADWFSGRDVPIAHILQRIQLRPGVAFTLKTKLPPTPLVKPEKLISLLPSPVETLTYLSRLDDSQSPKVKAEFAGKNISLKIQGYSRPKPIFSVELDGLPEPLAKNWVVGALGETTIPIDLRLHFANVGELPTLSLDGIFHFQLWESVKDVSLDGNFRNPPDFSRTFLQLFSTRCTLDAGSPVMPFPKLQNLYLSGLSGIKAKGMLDMVRLRFVPTASLEATVHGAVPVPFTIHCGNGVGGWDNKYMDNILATPGVQGFKYYKGVSSISSSTSSEPEWPPLYDPFGDDLFIDSDGFIQESDAELSQHGSDAEMSMHESTEGSLEVMDLRLQCMADFKVFFDDSVRRETVKHVRHRNALLPIGTLPTELLQDIFTLLLLTAEGSRKRRFVPTLITLRAVSWSWRDLLEGTPTFWTHISSQDDIRFVSEALEKSNHAPLHLQHIGKYQDGPESPFFEKVATHSHRWESVTIHQANMELAAKYFSLLIPTIKALLLSSLYYGISEPGRSSLCVGGLKDLEELRIAGRGVVFWRDLSCTRLRVLEIEGENSLDMGVVLDILAANPDLEVIRLQRLTFVQYVQPQSNPPPLILKGLKELMLKDITHITADWYSGRDVPIAHILSRIQLRPDIAFTLKTELPSTPLVKPEKFISLLPSPVDTLSYLSRLDDSQSPKVKAEFAGKSISLKIQPYSRPKPIFLVQLDGLPEPLAKDWVVGALGETTTPTDLRLHFANVGELPTLSLDEIFHFQLWKSVTGLSLDGNFRNPPEFSQTFLQLISTRCTSEAGSLVMPFPKLHNLYLSGLSGIKAKGMLDMVRLRFAPPGSPEATVDGAVPVPFTIHCGNGIGGWNNKHMDDILDTEGVQEVKDYKGVATSSSSTSSEPEWPPLYSYYDDFDDFIEPDGFIHESDAELSQHGSDAEMSLHELVADASPHQSDLEMSLHELYVEEGEDDI
ncbi:hypothetical protein FS837_002434 [Tulasnella sp. UAMH 9824]|nr:hypothetical protein FS837_002434 [Tulasnella sp. UAMH 9824]